MKLATRITSHFTAAEAAVTRDAEMRERNLTALELPSVLPRIVLTCELLEFVRAALGEPLRINSMYRGRELNFRVGGAPDSQHAKGEAADFWPMPRLRGAGKQGPEDQIDIFERVVSALRDARRPFGQVILERPPGKCWIHISLGPPLRPLDRCGEVLHFYGSGRYELIERIKFW